MTQHEEHISFASLDDAGLMALAYGSFIKLGWTVEFVTDEKLIGYSKKKWNTYYDHITAEIKNGLITINSKLPENVVYDLMKKNKKNVNKFITAFDEVKLTATETDKLLWKEKIENLKTETVKAVEKDIQTIQDIDSVMNLSTGSKVVTYSIMAINLLAFILMVLNNVDIFSPTAGELLKWGGNFEPFTMNGELWRLITCMFIHGGIIHLAFNLVALYMIGIYLEPMLGKWRYSFAYLITGIISGLASIYWYGDTVVSAGASGAIFGLYGVMLALLTTRLIPKAMRVSLLQSMGVFILYNLAYGIKSAGVDNAAHMGGLISGFILGYIYFPALKSERAALKPQ